MLDFPAILWSGTSRNSKTGNIPTAFIGASKADAKRSCSGCPLLESTCYAHNGAVQFGHGSMVKRADKKGLGEYTLDKALKDRTARAKYVRFTAIGDGARANPVLVRDHHDRVRRANLGWIAYTHFHEEVVAQGNQDIYCASAESMDQADALIQSGFRRATVVAPWDIFDHKEAWTHTPGGLRAVICPAIAAHAKGARVQCNECGLCDPTKQGPKVILFPEHGKEVRGRLHAKAKQGVEWAKNLLVKL